MTPKVSLDEETHVYTHINGDKYLSNSAFCGMFIEEFDTSIIGAVAAREGKTVEELQAEWDEKRDLAVDNGNAGHKYIEDYLKTGALPDSEFKEDALFTFEVMSEYHRYFSEELIYDEELKIATTCDLVGKRTKSPKSIIDFGDIKYNAKKFSYDSSKVKDGRRKQYNKYFTGPLAHLEYSYYTKTCLQIGLEMFIAERAGHRVGKGFIILCDWGEGKRQAQYLPVPYMKGEIEAMVESYFSLNAAF